MWTKFPGCECLKQFLISCGFDSEFSLLNLDDSAITLIDQHLDQNRHLIESLNCSHKQIYSTQPKIQLLPGHRLLLSKLPEFIESQLATKSRNVDVGHQAFSPVLKTMISTALDNYDKPPNTHRYPKLLTDFSIYTYLSSGKSSYKMICRNLPLPKESTVCMYNHNHALIQMQKEQMNQTFRFCCLSL